MSAPEPGPASRRARAALAGAALALVALVGGGVALAGAQARPSAGGDAPAAPLVDRGAADGLQDPAPRDAVPGRSAATAVRVEIPSIGVDSGLEQLALDASTGVLDPPVEWLSAGVYADGTVPGDLGPAVIAGHVDSGTAPAVFARLGELTPGAEVRVTLSDGGVRTFAVDRLEQAPKNGFPTAEVYGPTPDAQLRLITCDGDFDTATGHYVDNLIAYASLVG